MVLFRLLAVKTDARQNSMYDMRHWQDNHATGRKGQGITRSVVTLELERGAIKNFLL
jgi:hypothetical protein